MGIRYASGEHVGLADGEAVALIDSSAPAGLAEEVWEALRGDTGVAGAIQVIIAAHGGDVRAIPPFAVVAPHDDGAMVAVRGPLAARLVVGGSEEEITGAHVITWNERWVPQPDVVELTVTPRSAQAEEWLPLVSGVVRAGAIRHQVGVAGTSAPHLPAPPSYAEPTPAVAGPTPEVAVVPAGEPPAASPRSVPPASVDVTLLPDEEPAKASPELAVVQGPGVEEVLPDPEPDGPGDAIVVERTALEAGDEGYDHLFGRTMLRQVEDAAVREDDEGEDGDAGGEIAGATPAEPPRSSPGAQGGATGSPRGRLISVVPGMSDEYALDHDGETVARAALAGLRSGRAGGGLPPSERPTAGLVLGRTCQGGHICPPEARTCRSCGALLDAEPTMVPRPPLGSARLSSGDVLALESSLVLGRAPRLDRFTGPDLPTVVTVPSPTREISATHLGVRLEDWHVFVTDLGSSNGTVLQRLGQQPRRLHPHEAELVRAGDVVDLGDGLTIAFEDLP